MDATKILGLHMIYKHLMAIATVKTWFNSLKKLCFFTHLIWHHCLLGINRIGHTMANDPTKIFGNSEVLSNIQSLLIIHVYQIWQIICLEIKKYVPQLHRLRKESNFISSKHWWWNQPGAKLCYNFRSFYDTFSNFDRYDVFS